LLFIISSISDYKGFFGGFLVTELSTQPMTEAIRQQARALGFDTVGFAPAWLPDSAGLGLAEFLAAGHHGDMHWMETHADRRASPGVLWPQARSIIMLGHNYGPPYNPLDKLKHKSNGAISAYALNNDYHDIIKKKLRELGSWITATHGGEIKLFVDTAPVMEKPLAELAGLGWQGKHTCIVSREFGNWLFLGSIFTTLELTHDAPERDHCGRCTACIDICPTQAILSPRVLDARRCIAYLTIEHKGQIPLEFRKAIGNRIYGCDDCLAICPWNKFAQASHESGYQARADLNSPPLRELVTLSDEEFRTIFRKSPIKRIGRDRFVRNVLVAIGNSGDASHVPVITPLLADANPLVAEMAQWALEELSR
jgi:epoxyqueuosine reductase